MQIINNDALSRCITDTVTAALKQLIHSGELSEPGNEPKEERLFKKHEMATELGISLVTLTDWMQKGLPFLRLHKRVYFRLSDVINAMESHKGTSHPFDDST